MDLTEKEYLEKLRKLQEEDRPVESVDYDPISLAVGGPGASKLAGSIGKMGAGALEQMAAKKALANLAERKLALEAEQAAFQKSPELVNPLVKRFQAGEKAAGEIVDQRLANMGSQAEKIHPNVRNIQEVGKKPFSKPIIEEPLPEGYSSWGEWASKRPDPMRFDDIEAANLQRLKSSQEPTQNYDTLLNLLKKKQSN